LVQSLWKAAWRILRKLKIELSYDPAIPLLEIYPKETKTLTQKDTYISMFTCSWQHYLQQPRHGNNLRQTNTKYHMVSHICGI